MKTVLKASLEKMIWKWVADNIDSENWPGVYLGPIGEVLADAVVVVFDAVVDNQEYVVREGFLKRV